MDNFYRMYLAREVHPVDDEVLERALESFEGAALKFSADAISEATQRENYNRNVKRVKAEVLTEVKAGRVSVKEAAEHCYEMRNKIMVEVRKMTSLQGRAVAEHRKRISPTLEKLLNDKSVAHFGRTFNELNSQQKTAIHYRTIESSARPDAGYNTANKVLRVTGKVLIIVTVVYAAYDIVSAENKAKEAIKQGAAIGGGVAGTVVSGVAFSWVCGPGAPVCTIGILLAGGIAGSWATSKFMDSIDQELEEFTKWQLS